MAYELYELYVSYLFQLCELCVKRLFALLLGKDGRALNRSFWPPPAMLFRSASEKQ